MYVPRALRSQNTTATVHSNSSTTAVGADRTAPASGSADLDLRLSLSNVDVDDLLFRTCNKPLSAAALPTKSADSIRGFRECSIDKKTSSQTANDKPKKIGCHDPMKKVSRSGWKSSSDLTVAKQTNADDHMTEASDAAVDSSISNSTAHNRESNVGDNVSGEYITNSSAVTKAEIEVECSETAAAANSDVLVNEQSEDLDSVGVNLYQTQEDSVLAIESCKSSHRKSKPGSVVATRFRIGSQSSNTAETANISDSLTKRREDLDYESVMSCQNAAAVPARLESDCDVDNSGQNLAELTDLVSLNSTETASSVSYSTTTNRESNDGDNDNVENIADSSAVTVTETDVCSCDTTGTTTVADSHTSSISHSMSDNRESDDHHVENANASAIRVSRDTLDKSTVDSTAAADEDNALAIVIAETDESGVCSRDTAEVAIAAGSSLTDSILYEDNNDAYNAAAAAAAAAHDDDDVGDDDAAAVSDDDESWEKMFDESGEMLHLSSDAQQVNVFQSLNCT